MTKNELQINEWQLTSTNLHRIRQRHYQVAVLPVGAIEAHNLHLPQGQDFLHTGLIAEECCRRAWEKTQAVICLPTIPYGVDCNLLAYPLTIHVSQAVLDAMLREIITSLRKHDIRKIVLLNGHGGNEFKPLIRQIQTELDCFVFLCDWWKVGRDRYVEIFTHPDDHAGQMETSVAMALFPHLVENITGEGIAGDGKALPFRFNALRTGWVYTSRDFSKINDHCAAGDPRGASAEKGQKYLDLVCDRISEFLIELAQSDIDEHFPYKLE